MGGEPDARSRHDTSPLTPLGQKLNSLNKAEPGSRAPGISNDPMNTCDPLGFPRNTVFETRGVSRSGPWGPTRIVVLHQIPADLAVRLDGWETPAAHQGSTSPGGVPSRYYGYSVGRWEGDQHARRDQHRRRVLTRRGSTRPAIRTVSMPKSRSATRDRPQSHPDGRHPLTIRRSLPSRSCSRRTSAGGFRIRKRKSRCVCRPEMINYRKLISDPAFGVEDDATPTK